MKVEVLNLLQGLGTQMFPIHSKPELLTVKQTFRRSIALSNKL